MNKYIKRLIYFLFEKFHFVAPVWVKERLDPYAACDIIPIDKRLLTAADLASAWIEPHIPEAQAKSVPADLSKYRAGHSIEAFDALADCLRATRLLCAQKSILEVGCSGGYLSEVVLDIYPDCQYSGCDISPAFIDYAKMTYPKLSFKVSDACKLEYETSSFSLVISGCVILHVPEYHIALTEAVRVSKRYIILHRTPVLSNSKEIWYLKRAYGVEMIEIHFNEDQLIKLMNDLDCRLLHERIISRRYSPSMNSRLESKTYLFEKLK